MRQIISFLLTLVLTITSIQLPAQADDRYHNYLDGWKVACAWSTLSNCYLWNADDSSMKQPKLVVTYRLENADHAYAPGDIQFDIPGIGNSNRASILKASDLASEAADSEWNCVWNQDSDRYTFSNQFSVEAGQSLSGGFQLLWTLSARSLADGYDQEASPIFRVAGIGQIEMEPLSYTFTSLRDRYRINMTKSKLTAADYEEADHNYIWYEIETQFDKDWLARGLYRSSYYITVELPDEKDFSKIKVKSSGNSVSLEEIKLETGDIVWGFYPFKNRSGDIGSQYTTYYDQFQIGFLKEHFTDEEEEEYRTVTVHGHLDRLYHDEAQWVTEAGDNERVDDAVTFTVSDYSFAYEGYIYSHSKWNFSYETYPYSHSEPRSYSNRLNAVNIYNGKIVPFILRGASNRNYTASKAAKTDIRAGISPVRMASDSNVSALEKNISIPDSVTDWNDIHWKEHGLAEANTTTKLKNGKLYSMIHPELASDSNGSHHTDEQDNEPFVPDVTIWGAIKNGISWLGNNLSQLGNRLQAVGMRFTPLKAFAAEATKSAAKRATPSTVKKNSTSISQIGINGNPDVYSLVLGDDKLAIFLTDGSIRNLEDSEYDIAYVTIPSDSKGYDYEIYGAAAQDTPFDEYICCGIGNTSEQNTIPFPDGIKAVFVRVNNITGSYSCEAWIGVRLHLDWAREQLMAVDGEAVPDHENHLVNFSYLRSLYINKDGIEVNDCPVNVDSYNGTYGKELAERDLEVYDAYMMRGYSNIWLRSPITKLTSKTILDEFTGSNQSGFSSTITSQGIIQADDSGPLESFSLYSVIPDGLVLNLDTAGIRLSGSSMYATGQETENTAFEDHVSYSIKEYNGRTMLAADFDFSDAPLEISKTTSVSMSFDVTLKYADFIALGNHYTVNSYLMVHDDGLDKISGTAVMTDVYDINENGIISEKIAYSGASKTVLDSAVEWREYVSKYIKSAYSNGYEAETVTRLYEESASEDEKEKSFYTYRLDFGLGSNNAKNIDFFDHIEQGAAIAVNEANPDRYKTISSAWQGKFLSVDTAYAESMNLIPTVYYSTDPDQEFTAYADGWSTELPKELGDVKSIWVHLDTRNLDDGLMKTRQMTYVTVNMQAPSDRSLIDKTAVNQYYVQFDAYGISSDQDFESRYELPSAETYVKLLDTVGKITLQKVDADNLIGTSKDGVEKYAAITGAKFQIYDNNGNAMFEGGQSLNTLGQMILANIPYGTYQWEELEAPVGYQKIDGRHSFEVNGKTELLIIPNHRIPGEVTLTKYDQNNPNVGPLGGAEFELFNENGDQVFFDANLAYSETGSISRAITSPNGTVTLTNLPWGNYSFIETKAPDGYEIDSSPICFTIGKGQYVPGADDTTPDRIVAEVNVYDHEIPASIRLIKTDASDGKPVKGAVYSLFRKNKNDEAEDEQIQSGLKTNAAGELQVDGLFHGEYYFVETKNPIGYIMPSENDAVTRSVILDSSTAEQVIEITHTNEG